MGRRRRTDSRRPVFEGDGYVLINKPQEWTSFDVVNFVRSRFNMKKVGHCGTLDPAATGLLVIVFGKFTKLSQMLSGDNKSYDARMLIGTETDSYDLDGEVLAENDYSAVTEEKLRGVIMSYQGEQEQVPPMVSALKKGGKKLCDLARKGIEVEREARPITVHSMIINKIELPYAEYSVCCSKGTYIRSLCHDMGKDLGCGATLAGLHRTQSGVFDVADAVDIDTLKTWEQAEFKEHTDALLEAKSEYFTELARKEQ